ncbi:hypothetical protein D3C87_2184660 [compost metagenome]
MPEEYDGQARMPGNRKVANGAHVLDHAIDAAARRELAKRRIRRRRRAMPAMIVGVDVKTL